MIDDMEFLNAEAHQRDLSAVSEQLDRRGISVDRVIERVQEFEVAVPSWALDPVGTYREPGYREAKREERSDGEYSPPQSL